MPQKTEILKQKNEDKNNDKNIPKKNYSSNLLKKCQMKYNSYIKEHRDITMSGTKRYENKSGEYYLQNLDKFQKNNLNQKSITSLNLNNNNYESNYNSTNYKSNKNIIKVKKKKLIDELIPIPTVKQNNKIKNDIEKKNLNNAMDNAKYIRRFQYSNNITQKQIQQYKEMRKNEKIYFNKIKYIQIWWKTIFQIIKIQKYLRGYLYRIKLISILDQREQYIDKVLLLIKSLKKIFFNKFIINMNIYKKDFKKYYFSKWSEIINKKKIIKDIINNYSSFKIVKDYYSNNDIFSSRSSNISNNIKKEKDIEKPKKINNEKNRNRSLIGLYNKSIKNKKNDNKVENLSSSSFIFKPRKKNINIGIELSSSQILKRSKKNNIIEFNQTNYNKKTKKIINNNRINIFGKFKSDNKRNKSNHKKLNKNKNDTNNNTQNNIKEKYLKEKSYNDLKTMKTLDKTKETNSNKNLVFKNQKKNNKKDNINDYNKNIRLSINSQNSNINKSKKNLKIKKKMHKYTATNISNYSSNILNKKPKNKKIKVYENKLKDYNKKLNLENSENELLSLNKDNNNNNNNNNEKLQPYTESIFDESQFSCILDNSTLNNNKNTINNNSNGNENENENENDILVNNKKKMRSNSCLDVHSLLYQESLDINENKIPLKQYFFIWTKKTIFGLLIKRLNIIKNAYMGGKIMIKIILSNIYREFSNKLNIYFNYLKLKKLIENLNIWKIKIFIKEIKLFAKKYILFKYFNNYKNIISKKIIIQNIVKYQNNLKKKHKQIKRRNRNHFFYSDFNLSDNNFITDIPINNYNNSFINNNINLNNNTNNCYIINNLNYNDNTNKINIGLTYETDINKNNSNQINNTSFGIIRSKIIEFPKNIYKQKKLKQSLALYKLNNNNTLINDDFNNDKNINNCSLLNYNINSNINKTNVINNHYFHKQNLSKSVIIPNNINCLKPDLTAQKNQLIMVVNIIERHRKEQYYKLLLSDFKKWKNFLFLNINDNKRNKNNIINEKTGVTTDFEELSKNTISDGFRTESDSKSENKISAKSAKIFPNNQINSKVNLENTKGIYKKKTIGTTSNKNTNIFKKNIINTPNILHSKNISIKTNNISNKNKELINEDIEYPYKHKPLSDKNLDFALKNNDIKNLEYSSPEEYFGFKKVNKIEEMEISFLPLEKKQINITNNDININNNKNISPFNYNINNKIEKNNNLFDFNEIDKKEIIIEPIEECNEFEGDNENMIQKIKNEFENDQHFFLYRTFDEPIINFDIKLNGEEEKEDIKYNSMNII